MSPRTTPAEWAALFNFAGGGLVHMEIFPLLLMTTLNPSLFEAIAQYLLPHGDHADRPAAGDVPINSLFFEDDTTNLFQNQGGSWVQIASIGGGGGSGTVTSIATASPISGGTITDTGTISHADSAVTPGSYGDSTHVATLTVDAKGHLSAAGQTAISAGTVTSIATTSPISGGTITGSGTITHADSAVSPGSYGDATHVGTFTVDAKGHLSAAGSTAITATSTGTLGGAMVSRASAQTISANTITAISFDTEVYDDSGYYTSGSPTRITVPATGVYLFTAFASWNGNDGTTAWDLKKNGSTLLVSVGSSFERQCFSTILSLTASDYIELEAYSLGGRSTRTGTGLIPFLQVERLR